MIRSGSYQGSFLLKCFGCPGFVGLWGRVSFEAFRVWRFGGLEFHGAGFCRVQGSNLGGPVWSRVLLATYFWQNRSHSSEQCTW